MPETSPNAARFIDPHAPLGKLAGQYLEAMLARDRHAARALVMRALDGGQSIRSIYLEVFQPVQYEVGWLWQSGRITVGHEHYCTNATQQIMAALYPRLFEGPRGDRRMVAACVPGELHELGLRMLTDLFELDGWDTDFLGASTPIDSVISALEETGAELLAVGVTMHDGLEQAERLIRAVRGSARAGGAVILVGGYTVRVVDDVWRRLGADGTAAGAGQAAALAERLLAARRSDD